jgi:hypothetical protein
LLLGLGGCGEALPEPRVAGARAAVGTAEQAIFPSREAIAKIAAAPVPARLSDDKAKDVPAWELVGPLPDAVERAAPVDDSPWGKLFVEAVGARGEEVIATEAMRCVARENAAFYLANDARPAEVLSRFISARCGATTTLGGTSLQVVTGDERIPDDKLFAQFHDRTRQMIDKGIPAGRVEAGLAYVRKGGRAVIGLAVSPQTVRVERTPLVPGADGKVVIRGEALGPAVHLRGLVNRGRYGYAACSSSPSARLPRFEIACDVARDDEVAWITVSALPPGRLLGSPVVEMLAWPSGAPGKAYARLARTSGAAGGPSLDELVTEINTARSEAKLPPLRLAEQESRTAAMLAPHYFAAMNGGDGTADQVALGLLAGWEVEGTVRDGHFVSTWVEDATSWAEVVRSALSRPMGRETLLDPTAERVAIGPYGADRARGVVLSTYALFEGYRHDDDARSLAGRLASLRVERGVAAPRLASDLSAAADRAARAVQAGQRTPEQALSELMRQSSDRLGRNVRGWVAETTSLDRLKLPDELAAAPALTLGIGVAHHRREGQAWGRFVVLVVLVDESVTGANTARAGAPREG